MYKRFKILVDLIWGIFWKYKRFKNTESLMEAHFGKWSVADHQNRRGLTLALENMENRDVVIVETGSSAYGTDSSRLFDTFARRFGGKFYSVDIDPYPSKRLRFAKSKNTKFFVMDSVEFLSNLEELTSVKNVNVCYLDSWDIDWFNPLASAEHGRSEMNALKSYISNGTILIIDDTPVSTKWIPSEAMEIAIQFRDKFGVLPGKGAFFAEVFKDFDFSVLHHDYNLVLRFHSPWDDK